MKADPTEPDMYDLRVELCVNGASQDSTLEDSYSPVCSINSLYITVTLATAFGLTFLLLDVVNAFQNTILSANQMSYMYPPPFYVK